MAEDKITFTDEEGIVVEFTVIEEAMLGGVNYLLVVDEENDEEAYILTEVRSEEGEVVYEVLDNEEQLPIIMDYFNALLDDIDLEI